MFGMVAQLHEEVAHTQILEVGFHVHPEPQLHASLVVVGPRAKGMVEHLVQTLLIGIERLSQTHE